MNQYKEKKSLPKKKESKSIDLNKKDKAIPSKKKDHKVSSLTNKKYNMKGSGNIITASIDMINDMTALGRSIFGEISSIKNIPDDINNVASAEPVPNNNLEVP